MLRSGRSLRFTATEIEEPQALDIATRDVSSAADFADALATMAVSQTA